jgi:hypothetical protein
VMDDGALRAGARFVTCAAVRPEVGVAYTDDQPSPRRLHQVTARREATAWQASRRKPSSLEGKINAHHL